jgi:PAS domain S-box-containing protein
MSTPFSIKPPNETKRQKSFSLVEEEFISPTSDLDFQANRSNQFFSFLQHTPHATWITDDQFNLIDASEAFYDLIKIPLNEKSKKIFDLMPNALSNGLFQKHIRVKETGTPASFLQTWTLADETECTFLISIFKYVGASEMIQGQAILIRDELQTLSQPKKVDVNLLLSDHHATSANWEWNMRTNEIYRNQVMQDLIGFSNNDAQNLSWWFSRIHPNDSKTVRDTIKNVIAQKGHNWECAYRFKNNVGKYLFVHDRGFVIYEDGQPVRMICSFQDLTDEKLDETLRVDEKVQAQKEITETILHIQEKERDRVGNNLNENVNQILAAAKMFIESINPSITSFDSNKEKAVEYVLMAIKEIRKLYKEMLTQEPIIGNTLTDNINMLVDDLKHGRNVQVSFQTAENIETISTGRKATLFRIVQEQIKNIANFSQAKNVKVSVSLFKENVQLIIWDDGVGFDKEKTKWGIGFSSIHQRIKLYNGQIDIKTAEGKGCKLTIKIPLFN